MVGLKIIRYPEFPINYTDRRDICEKIRFKIKINFKNM